MTNNRDDRKGVLHVLHLHPLFRRKKRAIVATLVYLIGGSLFLPIPTNAFHQPNVNNKEDLTNISFMFLCNEKTYSISECIKSNIPTAVWKTYINRQYGYSIKYPRALICYDKDKKHVKFGTKAMPYISVDIYDNFNNIDLDQFVSQSLRQDFGAPLSLDGITWKAIKIDGRDSLEVSFENVAGGYTGKVDWYYLQKDTNVYRISILQDFNNSIKSNDSIIKTFKLERVNND